MEVTIARETEENRPDAINARAGSLRSPLVASPRLSGARVPAAVAVPFVDRTTACRR